MATINMNAVQFYNPSSTAPSLSARCAATLQKHRQSTGIPHRKEWSRVLELYSQSQNAGKDIAGKQDDHASDGSIAADEDDEFLLVDKVIRRALHLEASTEKPTNSALAAQGTDNTSFLDSSGSSMPAQSSLPGHLDGSKEQPVILDDDDDDDDNDDVDNNDDDSNSTSGGGISSNLNVDGIGRELGPPPSPTTPCPGSRPSSSRDPSLYPSAAPHGQSLEGQAIQQDAGCISRGMSEQPSYPALILSDGEDDEMGKGQQQQEAGEDREQEARNSHTSSNGDVDDDDNHQDNDESEGLQPAKERQLSPSCDPAIRRSHKRRLQYVDEGVPTQSTQQQNHQEIAEEKEQEGHNSNSVGGSRNGSRSGSDYDHRDDQDSDDSEGPQPAKRRWPSPSSSDLASKRSGKQRLQRPHDSRLTSPSKPAGTDPVPVQKEPQRPSPLVSDDSDDSEAPRPAKRRRPPPSNSDPTSKHSQKRRLQRPSKRRSKSPSKLDRSHTAPPQTQLYLSVNSDDYAQSQHSSTDDEQISTAAEYRKWPMHGFFKCTTIGNQIHYSMDFSLEKLQGLCAVVCPLHATPPSSDRESSAGQANLPKVSTRVKKTRSAPPSRSKRTPFTSKDNAMLVDMKENKGWSWKQIEEKFPQRTLNSLQVHYCTKLKGRVPNGGSDSN